MPLVSMSGELKKAQEEHYALPCFVTFEMQATEGILKALAEKHAPGIAGIYYRDLDDPSIRAFVSYVRTMAEEAMVPVSIILDHGASFEHCMKALSLGFSDVMYDGSKLPLEENIANTRLTVRAAHAMGASVEAEVGLVGSGGEYQSFGAQRKGFTDPDMAARFVAETGVDSLAVAIGTAHGAYEVEPNLALDLLQQIRGCVDVPLVLHGGSGLSDAQYRAAISEGICKINIFTNLSVTTKARMIEALQAEDASYLKIIGTVRETFHQRCLHYLDVFGASGKA